MNRRNFIKDLLGKGSLLGAMFVIPGSVLAMSNSTTKKMKKVIHKAASRGFADHGWLKSYHTFSFAKYYEPARMHFGMLRVLNDDTVAAGMGFGTHPHENMEIVSIPLSGTLEHKDSMGNVSVIKHGEVQIMSAGTGITHSEYNRSKEAEVKFLQIWVFPKKEDIKPQYDQKVYPVADRHNKFQVVVSPVDDGSVYINQDAWFSLGNFDKGQQTVYTIKYAGNGVYFFVLKGEITIDGETYTTRDGIGISETESVTISFGADTEILAIDVPMR